MIKFISPKILNIFRLLPLGQMFSLGQVMISNSYRLFSLSFLNCFRLFPLCYMVLNCFRLFALSQSCSPPCFCPTPGESSTYFWRNLSLKVRGQNVINRMFTKTQRLSSLLVATLGRSCIPKQHVQTRNGTCTYG